MVNFANSATGDSLEVGFLSGQHGNTAFSDCLRGIVSVAGCKGQTSGNTGHYRNEIAVVLCIVFAVGGCVWIPDGKADCHFGDAGQCNNWKLFCHGKEYGTPWNIDSLFRHDDNLVQCIHIDDVAIYFADTAIHLNKIKNRMKIKTKSAAVRNEYDCRFCYKN